MAEKTDTEHGHHRNEPRFCPRCASPLVEADVEGKRRLRCSSCDYVHFRDPKVAVGVVTGVNGKVLLARRGHPPRQGLWTIPSGYVDAGEVVEEAAIREVMEEVNVQVTIDRLVEVRSQDGNPVIFIVFEGTIVAGEPSPGPEATAVGLFSEGDLPELAFEHDGEIIRNWLKGSISAD